jgi:hypothetical protein
MLLHTRCKLCVKHLWWCITPWGGNHTKGKSPLVLQGFPACSSYGSSLTGCTIFTKSVTYLYLWTMLMLMMTDSLGREYYRVQQQTNAFHIGFVVIIVMTKKRTFWDVTLWSHCLHHQGQKGSQVQTKWQHSIREFKCILLSFSSTLL